MSDKAPHLLLCAALLAAPSALSWGWHKAAAAVMDNMDSRVAAARRSPAAVLTGGSSGAGDKEQGDATQQHGGDGSLLRMSYSTLPLVWAGRYSSTLVGGATTSSIACKLCRQQTAGPQAVQNEGLMLNGAATASNKTDGSESSGANKCPTALHPSPQGFSTLSSPAWHMGSQVCLPSVFCCLLNPAPARRPFSL